MPIVIDETYGPKPSMALLGGSASTLATPSVPFLPNGRSITLVSGSLRTMSYAQVYRTQPWVKTAVTRMAEHIARLPLQTFRYLDDAGEQRERDRRHPAARLLNRPRPRQTGFHFRWDMALSLYVHGNYVAWKRRPARGAPPSELWTLDWRCLIPIADGGRVLGWRWVGSGVPGLEHNDVILIEDTVHVAFAAPGGGEVGISPLESLGVTIRSEDGLQRYSEAAMRHGTRFGVAAILDPKAKSDVVARAGLRDELMDAHGGVDNAFKPAVLGGGVIDLKPLGEQSAVEAELISQRKVNREEIAAVIGIPGPVAGILDEAKYSSLREFHRLLYVTALGGPLKLASESVQAQLIDDEPAWGEDAGDELGGRFVEFSLDEVLRGDTKERWETYAIALDHGGLVLNDVRRRENLKPYQDPRAEEPLIAANNVRPLSNVGDEGDTDPAKTLAQSVLTLVGKHAARALDRAARAFGKDEDHVKALDAERVRRELTADLKDAELDELPATLLAETLIDGLVNDVTNAETADDVRELTDRYLVTTGGPA